MGIKWLLGKGSKDSNQCKAMLQDNVDVDVDVDMNVDVDVDVKMTRCGKVKLRLELLGDHLLHRSAVLSESGDTFSELSVGHGILGKIEQESGLVVNVRDLLNLLSGFSLVGAQLLFDGTGGVFELLEKLGGDGEEIATSEFQDLTNVTEGSTHNDRLVAMLTVVVVDLLD